MIQLYFVIKSRLYNQQISGIVYISTLWSIWIVALRAASEDTRAFKEEYRELGLDSWKFKHVKRFFCIKKGYILRLCYRFMDVVNRLAVILSMWLFIGGFVIFIILFVESATLFWLCIKTSELS